MPGDDTTTTCSNCQTVLGDLAVGEPCPNCGAAARTIQLHVEPGNITFTGQPVSISIGPAIEHDIAGKFELVTGSPTVREVASTREVTLRVYKPETEGAGWVVEAWDGDDLISMAPGPEFDDAYLAVGDEVGDAMKDAQED